MKRRSKWAKLGGRNYTLRDLGRPAIFLLPLKKLRKVRDGMVIENNLHNFLLKNFGSYTAATIPSFGVWRNDEKATIFDKCRKYEVSFVGKEKIPLLAKKLAEIAKIIGEFCVYFKAGQYSCLIYPKA